MDEAEKTEEVNLSFNITGDGNYLQIEFADGVHVVPDHISAIFGGRDALVKVAPRLVTKTYAEFYSGAKRVAERQRVNSIHRNILIKHFG